MNVLDQLDKLAHLLGGNQNSAAQNTTTFNGRKFADILPVVGNNMALSADVQPSAQPQVQPRVSFLPPVEAAPAAGLAPRDPNQPPPDFAAFNPADRMPDNQMSFLPAVTAAPAVESGNLPQQSSLPVVGANTSQRQRVVPFGQLSQDEQIAQDQRHISDLQANALPHVGKFRRLINGALEGLAHADPRLGLAGLAGSAIGGAGADFFSPSAEAGQRTNAEIAKTEQRLNTNLAFKDKAIEQNYKQAQIGQVQANTEFTKQKPAEAQKTREAKFEIELTRQQGSLEKIREARRLKGLDTKFDTAKDGSGRLVIVDGNGKQEFVKNEQGEFEYNQLEKPEATQIEDGTNADGSKKFRTIYTKGSQILTNDTTRRYQEAVLGQGQQRINNQENQFNVTLEFRKQQAKDANAHFETVNSQRQAALNQAAEFRAKGDERSAQAAEQRANSFNLDIIKTTQALEKTHKEGGLDDADYADLIEKINALNIK